jgi:hypothetical protein
MIKKTTQIEILNGKLSTNLDEKKHADKGVLVDGLSASPSLKLRHLDLYFTLSC